MTAGQAVGRRPHERRARRWALGYLALVAAVFVAVAVDVYAVDRPDATLSGIYLVAVTLPTSILWVIVDIPLSAVLRDPWLRVTGFAGPAACALVQAWLVWLLLRGRRD